MPQGILHQGQDRLRLTDILVARLGKLAAVCFIQQVANLALLACHNQGAKHLAVAPELQRQMGSETRAFAETHSLDDWVPRWMEAYREAGIQPSRP